MLKAVTFDLWQTLILDTPEGLRRGREERVGGIHRRLSREGIAVDVAAVGKSYDAVGAKLEEVWATRRDVGSRGQVRLLLENLGVDGAVPAEGRLMDALDDAYCLPILSALPVRNAGAQDVLRALSSRGLALGLVCNTGRTPGRMLRQVLDRLGLLPYLRVLSFSDEVGLRKPHPEIFQRTLTALGVVPAEAAHIGDDATTDVAGAQGVGMRAIHLCHAGSAGQPLDGVERVSTLGGLTDRLFPPKIDAVSPPS
jgi:putative hydrolase of the HAD superfamily